LESLVIIVELRDEHEQETGIKNFETLASTMQKKSVKEEIFLQSYRGPLILTADKIINGVINILRIRSQVIIDK